MGAGSGASKAGGGCSARASGREGTEVACDEMRLPLRQQKRSGSVASATKIPMSLGRSAVVPEGAWAPGSPA